jgi:hypothetical protein
MEPQRFFTGALNVLHAGFIKASRAQAKRHYARVHGGAVLELAKLRLGDGSDLLFRVTLDQSEFRGKLDFATFRKALMQLLAKLQDRIRFKGELIVYSNEETGSLLLNLPSVVTEDGRTNVMMLGVDKPEPGVVTLRLQFLDPEQFRQPAAGA